MIRRPMWELLAVVALLWPARIAGCSTGFRSKARSPTPSFWRGSSVAALVSPAILRARVARGAILALLAWKAIGAAAITPDDAGDTARIITAS